MRTIKTVKLPITELKNGQVGRVIFINGGRGINARLEALGIRRGVRIQKLSSFMGGGPVIVSVGTGEVAIGYGMSQNIFVEVETD
jgi:ferrous iron transport protein A